MHYVYILRSLKFPQKIYIGYTSDLRKRFKEHTGGLCYTTRRMRPFELVYYEAYKIQNDAQIREKQLKKHGNALAHLKRRITQLGK